MSDTSDSAALAKLIAEHDCENTVIASARFVDEGRSEALANLFAVQALLRRPNGDLLSGRDAILASYVCRPSNRMTRHLVLNTYFEHHSSNDLRATSQVHLWAANQEDESGPFGRFSPKQIVGRFIDEFEKIENTWRIIQRTAEFDLYVELDNAS